MSKRLWYTTLSCLLGSLYFSFEAGFLRYLWEADLSKLSFVIIVLFIVSFNRLGYLLHTKHRLSEKDVEPGFEISNWSMGIGMLGTVIGFISMTMAFHGVDISQLENIKELFSIATGGMSTALLTTATGLCSSLILRVLYYVSFRELG